MLPSGEFPRVAVVRKNKTRINIKEPFGIDFPSLTVHITLNDGKLGGR